MVPTSWPERHAMKAPRRKRAPARTLEFSSSTSPKKAESMGPARVSGFTTAASAADTSAQARRTRHEGSLQRVRYASVSRRGPSRAVKMVGRVHATWRRTRTSGSCARLKSSGTKNCIASRLPKPGASSLNSQHAVRRRPSFATSWRLSWAMARTFVNTARPRSHGFTRTAADTNASLAACRTSSLSSAQRVHSSGRRKSMKDL
mmetsp:Transcript_24367/g.54948  ORF Transcript_24367/g.54948 Transcript_24367/m.54948 type:complete len:204 (+) Transcript_24367:844-1455(+)